jgi:hypothetical protein
MYGGVGGEGKKCADLIAMASHGRTGMSQVFYGSVAAGVLHRVDRSLLLVRARGAEQRMVTPGIDSKCG